MKILSIVCGSVACYKYIDFARLMINTHKCSINTVLTQSAQQFITPILVSSTTGLECFVNDSYKMEHISLSRDIDTIIVFAATASFISKVACGIGGSLGLDILLAKKQDTKVVICPAMNVEMWNNPIIKSNVEKLKSFGFLFCGPQDGLLACGEIGSGRMSEIGDIANFVLKNINKNNNTSLNKASVVITGGATIEKIDDVRYITNFSSGLQSVLIANEFANNGHFVTLIKGKMDDFVIKQIHKNINIVEALSADDMLRECKKLIPCNIFIGVAAVCDFFVKNRQSGKIKKQDNVNPTIELLKNPDILHFIGTLPQKNRPQLVIGFAAEEEYLLEKNAQKKLSSKGANFIVANAISVKDASVFGSQNQYNVKIFGLDKNKKSVCIFSDKNTTKQLLAEQIYMIATK